jgi:hypothetical protein
VRWGGVVLFNAFIWSHPTKINIESLNENMGFSYKKGHFYPKMGVS